MTRKQRRAHGQRGQHAIARVRFGHGTPDPAAAITCPDCDSEVTIIEVTPRIHRAEVRHDDNCPWFNELKRDLS